MGAFVSQYGGSILVGLIIALAAGLIVRKMIRDKKAGKSSCSCGCDCGGCNICHGDSK